MGVYGDMLSFFPEQVRTFTYFHMTPKSVASYSQREVIKDIRGIFQYMKKGELEREHETLEDVNVPTLWTKEKLKVGYYFIQKEDETYRIVNPAEWKFEGDFYCYVLETFVGSSDSQEPFDNVDIGQGSYD